jgi:hypothetical protein
VRAPKRIQRRRTKGWQMPENKVAQYSRATDVPHSHVHQQLNNALGDTVPKATIETLNKRLAVLDEWLAAL